MQVPARSLTIYNNCYLAHTCRFSLVAPLYSVVSVCPVKTPRMCNRDGIWASFGSPWAPLAPKGSGFVKAARTIRACLHWSHLLNKYFDMPFDGSRHTNKFTGYFPDTNRYAYCIHTSANIGPADTDKKRNIRLCKRGAPSGPHFATSMWHRINIAVFSCICFKRMPEKRASQGNQNFIGKNGPT